MALNINFKKAIFLIVILIISSCASYQESLVKKLTNQGFTTKIYHSENFDIFTFSKITDSTKSLRIYIEGDGFAYINSKTPSYDPTPKSKFLIDLILQDNSVNILYIARPCQYIQNDNCQPRHWTVDRFSNEVILPIKKVIDKFNNYDLELVGYSGGGTIINHLSQKNIKNIRTIAGNIDLDAFVTFHKISKLPEGKVDYERLSRIPQIHFVGIKDNIIPINIFESYQKKLPNKNCVQLKIINGANHYNGFKKDWLNLLNNKPKCQ